MIPVRARTRRARMALVACALWLAGVEVLPGLHEALHDRLAPHRHDGDTIITVSLDDTTHVHPDGTIHYVTPQPRHKRRPVHDDRPRAGDVAGHAAGLAHHAAAIAPAALPITRPLPVDRRSYAVALAAPVEPVTRDRPAATARGPPRLVSSPSIP
jgi:hypothetical protein